MTVTHPAKRQGLRGEGVGSLWSFLTWPIHTLAAVSAALVAVGFAAVVIAVFYRYLLGAPLNGVDELTGYLVVAITSCGLGSALLLDQHIGVDILTASAGRGAKRGLEIWASLCVLVCAAILASSAWHTVLFNRDFGTYSTGPLEIPIWWAQAPMVPGAVVLGLAALMRLLRTMQEKTK
ncbi:MAG: TRAP transporter small permease [Paracoccus sp. BP8]|uniref:TRAP transporter small permease n=1 Tax=unclassified Paracoccus (in: a-proteobacteria) TaxID=2688777 RepID=UPI0004B9AC78|nr:MULTISPECIES: TRAP transporter small permease [unclassified Paracoccus (in: a-proteobacteria)]RQP07614.1 MAG: TRAP transporter small permease [Paracoccus sp. BP8]